MNGCVAYFFSSYLLFILQKGAGFQRNLPTTGSEYIQR